MSWPIIGLILISVAISALAQIILKHGMSASEMQSAMTAGGMAAAWAIVGNGFVLLGLSLYGAGALLWLGVLARVDVSQAYPFVGLGFVLTMAFAWCFLGESLVFSRILGTFLIVAGVVLVAHS
ncbi:MAG TPA: EamA family transporter [Candidatus Competibacteraceae bacterium]|nr:EamA family transporter [Candidatus Competibacter sp.]MDG4605209.1 EamA family transporter [Candidatus Contendobacter sp.]HRD49857.1 EamA family transporter [Candidatus Contendobacter sp.]HRF45896.1 EamA family transporter [Candidatus Competibacteraceae bacterium]